MVQPLDVRCVRSSGGRLHCCPASPP
jgi:hypothetical protein